ncbi:MAG: aromatic amino acid lyase, partial [Anaerolineae bacterium]|nr:aromatic amino acid lyase [Anaerolineae bacterium]
MMEDTTSLKEQAAKRPHGSLAHIVLDGEHLTIEQVVEAAYADPGEVTFELSAEAAARVARARQAVDQFVAEGRIVYGITTGFGAFKDKLIPPDQVRELQRNIIMSHAST